MYYKYSTYSLRNEKRVSPPELKLTRDEILADFRLHLIVKYYGFRVLIVKPNLEFLHGKEIIQLVCKTVQRLEVRLLP
jgi:hypothetical protein